MKLPLRVKQIEKRCAGLIFFTHCLALFFLKGLTVQALHLSAQSRITKQLLILRLQRGDTVEEHKVVSDHFTNIIGQRSVLLVLHLTGLSDPAVGKFR